MVSNTSTRPLVSFIVPVYNDEKYIGRCLQSIKNQDFPAQKVELIVLDNGSTDCTPSILFKLECPFRVIPDVHVSALRNYGASMAQGDFLAFVDSDVELAPHWLTRALSAFEDSVVVASGCFPDIPKEATWVQQAWDIHQRGRCMSEDPTPVPWLPSMNLVIRRETFCAVGGFNETLETAEDVDLCYRLGDHGTILRAPSMEAIHWGEAKDVATFWKKEVWRGLGNLFGIMSHGWRWDELPSLIYPVYVLSFSLLLIVSAIFDLWHGYFVWTPINVGLLCLPAFFLSINTAGRAKRWSAVPRLFFLYMTYGLARAYSVTRVFLSPSQKPSHRTA